MTFCVRPERMMVLDAGDGGSDADAVSAGRGGRADRVDGHDAAVTLDATVSNAEFLGDSTRTYLRWNGRELTVRSVDPLSGDVRVGFDGADAHVIDVESRSE